MEFMTKLFTALFGMIVIMCTMATCANAQSWKYKDIYVSDQMSPEMSRRWQIERSVDIWNDANVINVIYTRQPCEELPEGSQCVPV